MLYLIQVGTMHAVLLTLTIKVLPVTRQDSAITRGACSPENEIAPSMFSTRSNWRSANRERSVTRAILGRLGHEAQRGRRRESLVNLREYGQLLVAQVEVVKRLTSHRSVSQLWASIRLRASLGTACLPSGGLASPRITRSANSRARRRRAFLSRSGATSPRRP
jgi:hypothetical protein